MQFSRRLLSIPLVLALGAGALYLTREAWLTALGKAMIDDQGPAKAEVVVLLAGDYSGTRLRRAADMVREGYAPKVLVSGPKVFYEQSEADWAIEWAVRHGYPREWFEPAVNYCGSTACEARFFHRDLTRRGVRSFLLVTSDMHTGRAARLFRQELSAGESPIQMRPVAAYGEEGAHNWWRTRDGRKTFFFEAVKSLTSRLGV